MVESKEWAVRKVIDEVREIWNDRELIWQLTKENIPNFLTISRFVITFIVIYLITNGYDVFVIVGVFIIGALTDLFDGQLARKFKWESEFGRRADMVADRFLWIGTAIAFIFSYGLFGFLEGIIGIQLLFIMTREIISAPFVLIAFTSGNVVPPSRYIAKLTTFLQGFALPIVILSTFYSNLIFISFPLSILCLLSGFISAVYYLKDIHAPRKKLKGNKIF